MTIEAAGTQPGVAPGAEATAAAPAVDLSMGVPTPPAAAPAPTPAPQPAPEPKEKKGDEGEVTYAETGNQKLDYALGIIGKAGLDGSHPAIVAAVDGDFSLLSHVLATKGVQGHEALVAILQGEFEADVAASKVTEESIKQDVLKIAGSVETWNEVTAFIRGNADEGELETLKGLLSDPKTAKIAASFMTNLYTQQGGNQEPAAAVAGVAPAARPAPGANTPLSRIEFAKETQKLHNLYGERYAESTEYRALAARLQR